MSCSKVTLVQMPFVEHTHLWEDITDRPLSLPADAHTHVWADITDKPTTFAPTAHTHVWADITVDTDVNIGVYKLSAANVDITATGGKLIFENQPSVNLYRSATHLKTDTTMIASSFYAANDITCNGAGSVFGANAAFDATATLGVRPSMTTRIAQAIRLLAGQTADAIQIQTDGGTVLASINAAGLVTAAGLKIPTGATNGHVLTSDANGNASWQAAGGATGDYLPLVGGAMQGDVSFGIDHSIYDVMEIHTDHIATTSVDASQVYIAGYMSAVVPLTIAGAASQSADLTQWQAYGGTVLAAIDAFGGLVLPGTDSTFSNTGVRCGGIAIGRGASTVNGEEISIWNGASSQRVALIASTGNGVKLASDLSISFSSTATSQGTIDTIINRPTVGTIRVSGPTTGLSGIQLTSTVDQTTNYGRTVLKTALNGGTTHVAVYDVERAGTVTGNWHDFRISGVSKMTIDSNQVSLTCGLLATENTYDIGRLSPSPARLRNAYLAQGVQAGAPANTAIAGAIHGYAYTTAGQAGVFQGRAGQTGDILRVINATGDVMAKIGPAGELAAASTTINGDLTVNGNITRMATSLVATDAGNRYYGGMMGTAWKINRYDTTTFAKTSATVSNNPGITDLASAWAGRLALSYA